MAVLLVLQALDATCAGDGNDLTSYCASAMALIQGDNPYATGSPFPYIYPLFLAWAITPLTVLACPTASLIWALISVAALTGTLVILRRHAPGPPGIALLVGLCLILFNVIQNNLVNGQVNVLVLFLCTIGFHFSTRNRSLLTALALGIAAAIKLTPLILLLYLAARRQWLAAGATILVFVILCLIPGLVPGVDLGVYYGDYLKEFLVAELSDGAVPQDHAVFSLAGIWSRAGLPLNTVATGLFLFLVPGVVMWWDVRTRQLSGHSKRVLHDLRAFSLYLLAPLFVVPMSEVHHLIQALPAFVCLVAMTNMSAKRKTWILLALSLSIYLIASVTWRTGPLYFVSLVILVFGVMLTRRRDDEFRSSGQ